MVVHFQLNFRINGHSYVKNYHCNVVRIFCSPECLLLIPHLIIFFSTRNVVLIIGVTSVSLVIWALGVYVVEILWAGPLVYGHYTQ